MNATDNRPVQSINEPLAYLQDIYASGEAKLFTLSATTTYCYVRFKPKSGGFYYARAKTIENACAEVIAKLHAV